METNAMFDQFWAAYPRKVAKGAARKAFARIPVDEVMLEKMLAAISWQRRQEQWGRVEFIPHPATWLNGERWDDEQGISKAIPVARQIVSCGNAGCSEEGVYDFMGRKLCATHYARRPQLVKAA